MSREKLVAYLWPERDEERARHALADSVYRLNKVLGGDAVVSIGPELRLNPAVVTSDVGDFLEAITAGEWDDAVRLYTAPFLDGFFLSDAPEFERWSEAERTRLAALYASALERLAEQHAAAGRAAAAAEVWQRRAALDPYDARVAVLLMTALAAAGNRAGAIQHARVHARLLQEEFGTQPDVEVVRLAERLRAEPDAAAAEHAATETPAVVGGSAAPRVDAPQEAGSPRALPADAMSSGRSVSATAGPRRSAPSWSRAIAVCLLLAFGGAAVWWLGDEAGATAPDRPRVAVLPFDNLNADPESEYFAAGVTEDILTNLAGIRDLLVISTASLGRPPGANPSLPVLARRLGADYVLDGSVRVAGERVRVNVQLVDAASGTNVWADRYDRHMEDIFAVQSEIATSVAEALGTEIGSRAGERIAAAPTEDLLAYNLYLRGRYLWHQRTEASLLESARFFERAVERDSSFARAWAGMADAYAVLAFYDYVSPSIAYPRAKDAATRAIALDADLAEAHASRGYIALYYDWDRDAAEDAFRRAIELNPSYSVAHQWYANHLVATARFDEADRAMNRAREVNPLSLIANGALGWVYYYAGRFEDAVAQCDLALEMDPDWDLGHLWRGQAYEKLGRREEAIASLERAVTLSDSSAISVGALAHASATFGDRDRAEALLARLIAADRYVPAFEIAKVQLALGRTDEALDWLERAREQHAHSMVFLTVDPELVPLRSHPRFMELVERVGFAR